MKYFIFFLLVLTLGLRTKAQIGMDETVIPKSPTAAGLDQLDVVPVDLATGGANISFNLHTIKTKAISIPLNLRYHSGGIKVDEVATWVGLGWNLDAGGVISRSINGNPDEGLYFYKGKRYFVEIPLDKPGAGTVYGNYDTSNTTKSACYNAYHETCPVTYELDNHLYKLSSQTNIKGGYYVDGGIGTDPLYVQQLYQDMQTTNANPNSTSMPASYNTLTSNLIDPQPDEFNIRFPGYSGSFMFNKQGIPQLNPVDKDLKISVVYNRNETDSDVTPSIDSWVVSTTDGLQYYFGNGLNAKTTAAGGIGSRNSLFNSPTIEWYLTKIIDVNSKDSITFNYNAGSYSYKGAGVSYNPFTEFDEEFYLYLTCSSFTASAISPSSHVFEKIPVNGNGPVLKNIATNKEVVNFYTSLSASQAGKEPAKLDSIIIVNVPGGAKVSQLNFSYGSFGMNKKLKLINYQKQCLDNINIQPPTSFSYYDTIVAPKIIGTDTVLYAERAQDYWGYYNNAQQNYLSNLLYPSSCSKPGYRKAVWPFAQLGVLDKITYPTGGQTVLEYEPHTASAFYDAGSTSIDQEVADMYNVFSLDTIGGLRVKKVKLLDSAGRTNLIRQYSYTNAGGGSSGFLNITPSVTMLISDLICSNDPTGSQYLLLSNSNRTPFHSNNGIVTYGRVVENILDSLGNSNGYTAHTFYNDLNTPDSFFSSSCSDTSNAFACTTSNSLIGLGNMPIWLSHHSRGKNLLNGYEIDKQIFTKDNRLILKSTNAYTAKQLSGIFRSLSFMGRHSGPCNVGWSQYDPGTPPVQYYYYMNYYLEFPKSVFLSATRNVNYTTVGDSIVDVQQIFHESPYHLNITRTIHYSSIGDTLSTVNLYAFDLADTISGDTTPKLMKAAYLNPLIISSTFKGGQIRSSKLTIYKNFGTASIPSIYPGSTYMHRANSLVTPLSIYGAGNKISYPVSTYYPDNNYTQEETYTFLSNGNLTERTKRNDAVTAFIWDYNNNLPIAEVAKAKAVDIAYTSFEADGTGGWTIGSPIRDTLSVAVTGRASYLISNGSISKSGLTNSRNYRVSYWTKNASAYSISGTMAGYPIQGKTINGWTYFEHKIAGQTSVSLSGTNSIDELRLYPDSSQMSSLTYDPMTGMTSQCDVNNRITYYAYDGFQRLAIVSDQERNILKKICYNYAGQPGLCSANLFYSSALSQIFTRNNCGEGYVGSAVTYMVPYGKYTATSISAANTLAQSDIAANGQANANANGSCTFVYYNVVKSGTYTRNNCGVQTGSSVTYTVAANTYSSFISQADADQQAQNDVNTNGQNYANTNGVCLSDITITSTNLAGVTGFTAKFTNTSTNVVNTYTIPAAGGTLGTIPSGNYNVTISKSGNTTTYYLAVCSNATDGATSVTINNIAINSGCNTITIDFIE